MVIVNFKAFLMATTTVGALGDVSIMTINFSRSSISVVTTVGDRSNNSGARLCILQTLSIRTRTDFLDSGGV